MLNNTIRIIGVVCAFALAIGCSSPGGTNGIQLGEVVPKESVPINLADVLADPEMFNNARVVLKGVVASQCSSLCHFNFQDGLDSVAVYPQGFKLPRLGRGKKVTLYAQVFSGEGQISFSLLGLQMEQEGI